MRDEHKAILGIAVMAAIGIAAARHPAKPVYHADTKTLTFGDYACTDDCSGHQAGYDWAKENDVDDEDDCGGNSQSFIEGCKQWVSEYQDYEQDQANSDNDGW